MEDKLYNLGLVCGRFGHIHNGHINLLKHSLTLCNKTLILVGSCQESGTLRNPFSADLRINLIKTVYSNDADKIIIGTLEDMTNEYDITYDWGNFVKTRVEECAGRFADLIVNGDDKLREGWFSPKDLEKTSRLVVARNNMPISATKIRTLLATHEKLEWEKYTPKEIHPLYDMIRNKLLSVPVYKQIYDEACKKRTYSIQL